MKKIYLMIVLALSVGAFQSTAQVSAGVGLGILKSTEDNSNAEFGGEIYVKYELTDNFRAGVNLAFYQRTEEFFGSKIRYSSAPISVSGEYSFLDDKFRPYLGMHLGLFRSGIKSGNTSASNSYFSLAPVLGIDYELTDNVGLNVNFKYGFVFFNNDFTGKTDNFSTISPNIGVTYRF